MLGCVIPLHDDNPTTHPPILTIAFIVVNVLVFLWQIQGGEVANAQKTLHYAAIPHNVAGRGEAGFRFVAERTQQGDVTIVGIDRRSFADATTAREHGYDTQPIAPWITLFTSMFMHGGWMHLIGNMWFLWIFGNNVEDALGRTKFLAFYLLTGLVASGLHVVMTPSDPSRPPIEQMDLIPTLGASGALSGALGAYLILYPRARVLTLVPLGYFLTTIELPAVFFLGLWFLMQIVGVLGAGAGVAWYAHIGGFAAGLLLGKLLETAEHRSRPRGRRGAPAWAHRPRRTVRW